MSGASRLVALIPLSALGLGACEGSEAGSAFQSVDSAGVTVSTSSTPLWESRPALRWTLDSVPALDLTTTGRGPAHEFYRVADVAALSDGRILVADGGTSEVRAYEADGSVSAVTGREGEGPGEYRQISTLLALPGDTVAVFSWPDRMSVLGPDLGFVRSHRLEGHARGPELLDTGDIVVMQIYPSLLDYEGGSRLIREPVSLVRLDREGVVHDTVWTGPGYEEYMYVAGERGGSMRPLFGKGIAFATRGASIVVGTTETLAFSVLNAAGRLEQIVRVSGYDLSLDPATVEAERAAYLGTDPAPPEWRDLIASLPAPESKPAYDQLVVDAEGSVWAGEHRSRIRLEEPRRWEIFAPDGRWLGALHTPARFELMEVGADHVLGVYTDELDVEHVRVLRLHRGSGG